MDLVAIIATVILLSTLLTMVFSFAAYFVTRAKTIMKSKAASEAAESQKDVDPSARIYFERYDPKKKTTEPIIAGSSTTADQWR